MSGPKFVPSVDPATIQNRGENVVARQLMAGLDSEWTVFHSYSWLLDDQNRRSVTLREGEADFVLLHRRYGLLVLEVKGGTIAFDPETGLWRQNDHFLKDPIAQASGNRYKLLGQIRTRCEFPADFLPCSQGFALAFPECNFSGTMPPGAHSSMVFSDKDMDSLGKKIVTAARHYAGDTEPQPMSPFHYDQIKKALQSTFRIVPSLARAIQNDEEMLLQLTEQQSDALAAIYANDRVVVEGTAGSGKTLLALDRARSFSEEGKSVLLLCYNRKLSEWLQKKAAPLKNVKVSTFHGLCHEWCLKAKQKFEPPAETDRQASDHFWSQKAPDMLLGLTDDVPDRFDAIVVDEAQDFQTLWWTAVEALLRRPNGPLYVFFDRSQNLFRSETTFPGSMVYKLDTNCRNTRRIVDVCSKVLETNIKVKSTSPLGVAPIVASYSDPATMRSLCAERLKEVIGQEKFRPSQIAILSPHRMAKSALTSDKLGSYTLTDNVTDWQNDKAVWFSSIKAFKGLEAEILLLVDVDDLDDRFNKHALFVACSRARHRLYVYTNSDQVKKLLS